MRNRTCGAMLLSYPCKCEFCQGMAVVFLVADAETGQEVLGKYGYTSAEARALAASLIRMADEKDAKTAAGPAATQGPALA